jgi:hypothetical protein
VTSTPEVIFGPASRVDQWFFPDKQRGTNIDHSRQPKEKKQTNDSNDPDGGQTKVESFGDARAHTENPRALPIAVKSSQWAIINIPGALTHY